MTFRQLLPYGTGRDVRSREWTSCSAASAVEAAPERASPCRRIAPLHSSAVSGCNQGQPATKRPHALCRQELSFRRCSYDRFSDLRTGVDQMPSGPATIRLPHNRNATSPGVCLKSRPHAGPLLNCFHLRESACWPSKSVRRIRSSRRSSQKMLIDTGEPIHELTMQYPLDLTPLTLEEIGFLLSAEAITPAQARRERRLLRRRKRRVAAES